MKKYDSYKDSGIEWIGEIPSHWESWKISHAFNRIGSGTTPESGNPIYHENGTVNWLNTGDLNDGFLDSCSKQITQKALEDYSSLKLFPAGSLVIAMYGATIGKTAILNFETTTNQACCVFCESEIINLRFLQYWFIGNKEQIINLAIGGGQPNISQNILKDIRLWCPDYSEQLRLINYLDYKTTQIDDLIAKKERLIQLLEEERTAIINQAVTKGLDPTVPMKDSGIEWLGEIPAHWEVKKLAFEFQSLNTKRIPLSAEERGRMDVREYDYYGASGVIDKVENYLFEEDLILIGEDGANLVTRSKRLVFIASGKYWVNNHAHIIKPTNGNINYFCELLELIDYTVYISGSAQPKLTQEALMSIKIPVPPPSEQNLIFNFLERELETIDKIKGKSQQEIELLKEYKTALISEVVTGKVDVREEKIN